MTRILTPLLFRPILVPTVWGGHRLASLRGDGTNTATPIGESWELSGLTGHVSEVAGGPFARQPLDQLIATYREQLVGHACWARYGTFFPLLVKFIDTAKDLSIQVHPNREAAARLGSREKNEMWYVVGAEPGARLLCGWKHALAPADFRARIADKTLVDSICAHAVRPGDLFYLPAGRIHALGSGMQVIEIQDASDTTYRVYDYDRPGLDGRPRELHVGQAAESLDFTVHDDYQVRYAPVSDTPCPVVEAPHFSTRLWAIETKVTLDYTNRDSFVVLVGIAGRCSVEGPDGFRADLKVGDTLLVPAVADRLTVSASAPGSRFFEVLPKID